MLLFFSLDTRKARQLPASVTLLFNISLHSQKQLRQFKYTIVSLVNTIVSGLSYTDIQRDMEEGGDKREQLLLRFVIYHQQLYSIIVLPPPVYSKRPCQPISVTDPFQ